MICGMQVISTIESYVVDSLQYLQGLMPSYDLLACMREQRDRFLTRLLVDLYLIHAQNLLRDGAHVQSFILVRTPHFPRFHEERHNFLL